MKKKLPDMGLTELMEYARKHLAKRDRFQLGSRRWRNSHRRVMRANKQIKKEII